MAERCGKIDECYWLGGGFLCEYRVAELMRRGGGRFDEKVGVLDEKNRSPRGGDSDELRLYRVVVNP